MEKNPAKSPVKAWAGKIVMGWFIVLAFCEGIWLDWPPFGEGLHMGCIFLSLFTGLLAIFLIQDTISFLNAALTTVPVSTQEFPPDIHTEFVCDFATPPPSGVLVVELNKAKRTEFSFEIFDADHSEVKKTVRQRTHKGAMSGPSSTYFALTFNNLPSWATGVRVRVKPVNPVSLSGNWITGRIALRAKKLASTTVPLAAAQK